MGEVGTQDLLEVSPPLLKKTPSVLIPGKKGKSPSYMYYMYMYCTYNMAT